MNLFFGLFLFVLSGVCSGAILGGLSGLFLAGINNYVLVAYFGAATATYPFWTYFMAQIGSASFGLISLAWGLFLTYQKLTGK